MPNLTTRRTILRGGALLTASSTLSAFTKGQAACAQAATTKPNLRPSPVRLGVASYSLRNLDPAAVIAAMKGLRTPYLNVKDTHLPMTPADQVASRAATYRAAGMTLTAAGTIYFNKDEDDDVRAKFEYCKAAGVSLMVAAPTHVTLPRVERFAKQYDMRIAIHNHGPEDKEWPSPLDVLAAVKGMDPRMGCCLDVGHAMRAGTDVVDAIGKAGPRLFDMHMKDLASPNAKESQVAVGEGVMPVRAIFEALIAIRYPGFVDLEYEIKPEDPLPGMVESFAYMRGVLSGMGYTTA